MFSSNSTAYPTIPDLQAFISLEKCSLAAEFSAYNIINGGITIPIAISVRNCRPMDTMYLAAAVNNPNISPEPTLSTHYINSTSHTIYIVLAHQFSSISTLGQSYQLRVNLTSSNTVVNSAYNPIPNITINVVGATQLIGNP